MLDLVIPDSGPPKEDRKAIKRQNPHAGEAIREFTDRIRETIPAEDQVLVLFEEDAVKGMNFGDHVHLLHTYAFLLTLENLKVIPSAEAIVDQIHNAGRLRSSDPDSRRSHRHILVLADQGDIRVPSGACSKLGKQRFLDCSLPELDYPTERSFWEGAPRELHP